MCVRKNFHFVPELWKIIFEMINHMKFLKSDQIFGQEILFRVDFYRYSSFSCFNNARINQLIGLCGGYYMIIDLEKDCEILTCVDIECQSIDGTLWEIYIGSTSPITFFTFQELCCESAMCYNVISDFNISSPHCKIIKYTK